MSRILTVLLVLNVQVIIAQNVVEVSRPQISDHYFKLYQDLAANRDSGFYKGIEILEKGLNSANSKFEQYQIYYTLGFFYTETKQYGKCIDMWKSGHTQGISFRFKVSDKNSYPSYLSRYSENIAFKEVIKANTELINKATQNSKAEYIVCLPNNYKSNKRYPLIIVQHGGVGDFHFTSIKWQSEKIKNDFIAVYTRGRYVKGSYARSYGESGISDILEIYNQVIKNYPIDTSRVVLAGQSSGGNLSIRLTYDIIKPKGLLLAFPTKPNDFDNIKAHNLKENKISIAMIYGAEDKQFRDGQNRFVELLEEQNAQIKLFKYPDLGHGFPSDFSERLDESLNFILEK